MERLTFDQTAWIIKTVQAVAEDTQQPPAERLQAIEILQALRTRKIL